MKQCGRKKNLKLFVYNGKNGKIMKSIRIEISIHVSSLNCAVFFSFGLNPSENSLK